MLSISDESITSSHYPLGAGAATFNLRMSGVFMQLYSGSIKSPITIPESYFEYLTVLSMPRVSFEFL